MQLSIVQAGDVQIVRVTEPKLTYPVLSSFFADVRQVVEDGARQLVIDLQAVNYIDSASIGALMDVYRLVSERGGALKLSGLQPRVETMLSLVGVRRILDVHDDEAQAVAAFRGKGGSSRREAERSAGTRPGASSITH